MMWKTQEPIIPTRKVMKQITMMLESPPYSGQDVDTLLGIADAALKKGHRVTVVGSGDGTYAFLKGQRASGAPNAEEGFVDLIGRGGRVEL
jgi:sulfur relay (sulfurtransferase) complex TusBCD TusD component (DsrE family)